MISYDINDIILYEDQVVFSSSDGLFMVDKQKSFKTFRPIDICITDVTINDQKRKITDLYKIKENESALRISFNSNGYRGTSSGHYEYRMLGLEDTWVQTSNGSDQIQYGNLPQGEFEFQLRSTNTDTDLQTMESIKFIVAAPFFQQAWFWILLVAILVAITVLYYKRKLRFRESTTFI